MMAMTAVAVGYLVGSAGSFRLIELLSSCFGIGCIAVSSSLLNQWFEQDTDRRMKRTASRPLVTGTVRPGEVLLVGLVLASAGTTWLWLTANLLTAFLAAMTIAVYVCVYTPLKQVSSLCTAVGAVPGALPPVLGWTAAAGRLDESALALFLLLFAWQFPHFLAIATIHRQDYEDAGLKMLPMAFGRSWAGPVSVVYASVLIPVSLMPWSHGLAGTVFAIVALILGTAYLAVSIRFLMSQSVRRARQLLLCSIIYLPLVLLTMTCEHYYLLR